MSTWQGFVKIARWNDINFWSVKSAVEKTHQILHRHTKEWENVLRQPVKPLLTDTKADWSQRPSDAGAHEPWSMDVTSFSVKLVIEHTEGLGAAYSEESLLARLPKLRTRMHKHCRHLTKSLPYGRRVTALDQFTGKISCVHSFVRSFVLRSFVRSFVHSFIITLDSLLEMELINLTLHKTLFEILTPT